MIYVDKGCFQTDLPVELILGAEGLVAVGLGTVERFLPCVSECVDLKLILWAEEGATHQTLVATFLLLWLLLSLTLRPHLSWTSKQLGGSSSILDLRRQCGYVVWGIGGSCCHGSPMVPLPLNPGRGCPTFQALFGSCLGVEFKGVGSRDYAVSPLKNLQWTICKHLKLFFHIMHHFIWNKLSFSLNYMICLSLSTLHLPLTLL